MKKFQLRSFLSGVLFSALIISLIGTAAATIGQRNLTADYTDIKIELDGKQLTPTDANGNAVEPFAVNGTTYLPVRAVANALGLTVRWDGSTSTVTLSSQKSNLSLVPEGNAMLMGYYKILEEGFSSCASSFLSVLSSEADINRFLISEGSDACLSLKAAAENHLQLFEEHYAACRHLLSDDDVVQAAEYRRLVNIEISNFSELAQSPNQSRIQVIAGSSQQNHMDCMWGTAKAKSAFWASYQNVFNPVDD